jgi:choline transport protein
MEERLTTRLPFAQICMDATGSKAATTIFILIPCLLFINSVRGIVITSSRVLMSLGRDNVLPYARVWEKTIHGEPIVGLGVSMVIPILCGLVQLGSASAFSSLLGAATIVFELSYGELMQIEDTFN